MGCTATPAAETVSPPERPRIIITTDLGADPDDEQSMVRYLAMSNEYETEGLIVATGCWIKSQEDTVMLDRLVGAYGEVEDNLRAHADGFPSLEYLQSISVMGQRGYGMTDVGAGMDSPGSDLIIAAVDKDDPRPVWANCWGGCNTIAQALYTVRETRSDDEVAEFVSRLRVFDILGQDDAGTWIAKTFPDLLYIRATGVYGWAPSDDWIDTHVQDHGPLGAQYPDRKYATEGDTPAFMHLNPNGLNDPDHVDQGGWGGRFDSERQEGIRGMSCMEGEDQRYDPYLMYGNTAEAAGAISRWQAAYDNDFEARMDWTLSGEYSAANHHPVAVLNEDDTRNVLTMHVTAGSDVALTAAGSSDPDGDALSYSWSVYEGPSTYDGAIAIRDAAAETATLSVPSDASGSTIHVILEIRDSGSPALYAIRRAILAVE